MSTRTIGGTIDYSALADLHRPTDPDLQRVAVHELAARGLTVLDISNALRLDPALVEHLLQQART